MNSKHALALTLFIASLAALPASAGDAVPTPKDEARWDTPDTTPQQRYETARKEAAAAYQQALADCKALSGAEKSSCVKEAKANFEHDSAEAKKVLTQQ
jgi:hypothetical protein